jgi:hypothetical protein
MPLLKPNKLFGKVVANKEAQKWEENDCLLSNYRTDYALSAHMINIMVSLHHNFTLQANNPNTEKLFFFN